MADKGIGADLLPRAGPSSRSGARYSRSPTCTVSPSCPAPNSTTLRAGSEAADVLGVLSLIFWSLLAVVTLKYVIVVLRADNGVHAQTKCIHERQHGHICLCQAVFKIDPLEHALAAAFSSFDQRGASRHLRRPGAPEGRAQAPDRVEKLVLVASVSFLGILINKVAPLE